MQDSAAPIDGRAARAARTRDAIVDATVSLIEAGDLRPTAPRIAERAGVSVRSVFQHFDDLPALHAAVVQRVIERLADLVVPVDPGQPFPERLTDFVRHRSELLEAVTPFRRAAAVHGPFAPRIRKAVAAGLAYHRTDVEAAFTPELESSPADERDELLDALAAASSWTLWDSLRSEAGRSPDQARAVMDRMLRALLAHPPAGRAAPPTGAAG